MRRTLHDLLNTFAIFYFAAGPSATPGSDAGGGAPASGGGGGTPGAGSAAGTTPPPTIDWATAPQQFRDGYQKLKTDFEALQGKYKPYEEWSTKSGVAPDQLESIHGTYQEVYDEIGGLAEALGRAEDDVQEAIQKHGVLKVLDYLRGQYAKSEESRTGADQDINEVIDQALAERLGPIEQREQERLTQAGNQLFEQIVHQSIVDAFKAEGLDVAQIPEKESFMLMNATSEILKYEEPALIALKQGAPGARAAVQKAFQQAKTFLDEYYLSRSGRERGRIQGPPKVQAPGQPARKPTLDEMIEEPTLVNAKYKVGT